MFRITDIPDPDAPKQKKIPTDPGKRGRKKGIPNKKPTVAKLSKKTLINMRLELETGLLPHEFLLQVMRGEIEVSIPHEVDEYDEDGCKTGNKIVEWEKQIPDLAMRIDAAKAAAPYYAPRLAAMQIDLNQQTNVTLTSITLIKKSPEEPQGRLIESSSTEDKVVNGHFIDKMMIKSAATQHIEEDKT